MLRHNRIDRKHRIILAILAGILVVSAIGIAISHHTYNRNLATLLDIQAQNQADTIFRSDSLQQYLVRYFDRKGTHNDRLLAHYLLGRAYADMGDAPAAIQAYLDAADCADTTSTTCDLVTLSSMYSQMADVFYHQLLLSQSIESRNKSIHYSLLIGDTINAIYDYGLSAAAYILLNNKDSAEHILLQTRKMYLERGFIHDWAISSTALIYLYLHENRNMEEVKAMMDLYEKESGIFDKDGELPTHKRKYYRFRALYHENQGDLDSAEFYYRKMFFPGMKFTQKDAMFHGLLRIFQKRNNPDSITKYARLYCEANDSSIAIKDRELTAQMTASYNYERVQQVAAKEKSRADAISKWLIATTATILLLIVAGYFSWYIARQRRAEQKRLLSEYDETINNYEKKLKGLTLLEQTHQKVLELLQHDLEHSKEETEQFRAKYAEGMRRIDEINAMYAENIRMQELEANSYKEKLKDLQRRVAQAEPTDSSGWEFMASDIVRLIIKRAKMSRYDISPTEWDALINQFRQSFGAMYQDLSVEYMIKQNGIKLCILLVLQLRESDIANILNISSTAVSNIKSNINMEMFGEKTSRTLYRNLSKRYGLNLF